MGADKLSGAHAYESGDFCGFLSGAKSRLYVGTPSMSSVCEGVRAMADLRVLQRARVTNIRMDGLLWSISYVTADDKEESLCESSFHAVVVASQTALAADTVRGVGALLEREPVETGEAEQREAMVKGLGRLSGALGDLGAQHQEPLFALSASFPSGALSGRLPFDAAVSPTSPNIRFVCREGSKPGRSEPAGRELWSAVTTPAFARELMARGLEKEAAAHEIGSELVKLLSPSFERRTVPAPLDLRVARWRSAFTAKTLDMQEDCVSLEPWRLAICGDFLRSHPSPIEAAAMSGMEAGERVASWFAGAPQ